jgi:hypothetical protein
MFNLATNAEHPVWVDARWYVQTTLFIDGKYKRYPLHRLVAKLFVGIPERHIGKDFEELQVNHIDAFPPNNHCSNLEWVSNLENQQHARALGLFINERTTLARHVITGKIVKFASIAEAARHAVVYTKAMVVHVNSVAAGRIVSNGFVYKLDDGRSWPAKLAYFDDDEVNLGTVADVIAENIKTGQKILTLSMTHACRILGLSRSKLNYQRCTHGLDKPYEDWIFYPLDENNLG